MASQLLNGTFFLKLVILTKKAYNEKNQGPGKRHLDNKHTAERPNTDIEINLIVISYLNQILLKGPNVIKELS